MEVTKEEVASVIKDLLMAGFMVGRSMEPIIASHLKKAKIQGYHECQTEVVSGFTKEERKIESLIDRLRTQTTVEAIKTLQKWKEDTGQSK